MSPKKIIFLVSVVAILTTFSRAQATNTINANVFTASSSINFVGSSTGSIDGKNYSGKSGTAGFADGATYATGATSCTYLSTTPTKCSAGNYPLGIDVYGNAVNCTALPSAGTDSQQLGVSGNTITLTNSSAITAPYATNAGYSTSAGSATNCTNANYLSYSDNRTISPKNFLHNLMAFGFGSYNNNNTAPWADFMELNSYQDASGGNDNLLVFNRFAIGARLYQQTYNSTSAFSTYKDIVLADNSPTANYLPKYTGTGNSVSIANSQIFDNGTSVGVGNASPGYKLDVGGSVNTSFGNGYYINTNAVMEQGPSGYPGSSLVFNRAGLTYNLFPNGNVGIGTTAPGQKLHVAGNIAIDGSAGYYIYDWNAGDTNWRIGMNNNPGFTRSMLTDHVQFMTYGTGSGQGFAVGQNGGSSSLEIRASDHTAFFRGNVGVGTTNPGYKLDVVGDINLTGTLRINGNPYPASQWATNGSKISYSTGNVGIGTSDPYQKLEVANGDSRIQFIPGESTSVNTIKSVELPIGLWDQLKFAADTYSFNLDSSSSALYIDGSGRVGIGSGLTAPTQLLQVAGNIYLSSGTFNTMYYGTSGVAAPGAGSYGEKIQLYGAAAGTNAANDYALGIENSNLWFNTAGGFKFYTNSSLLATLNSSGFSTLGNISAFPAGDTGNYSDTSYLALGPNSSAAVYIKAYRYNYSTASGLDLYYRNQAGNSALGMRLDTNGNIGIGTTNVTSMLTVNGNATFGGNKVTAGTFDPVYTINNKRFATYLSGMTGVKEETAGVISLDCSGKACSKTIDFNNLPEGSDLWLFSKVTNLKNNFAAVSVLLTPSVSQPVWYEKDVINNTLTLKTGNTAHRTGTIEVSYRLTAPRFDTNSWKNTSTETDEGFNLDKLIK